MCFGGPGQESKLGNKKSPNKEIDPGDAHHSVGAGGGVDDGRRVGGKHEYLRTRHRDRARGGA